MTLVCCTLLFAKIASTFAKACCQTLLYCAWQKKPLCLTEPCFTLQGVKQCLAQVSKRVKCLPYACYQTKACFATQGIPLFFGKSCLPCWEVVFSYISLCALRIYFFLLGNHLLFLGFWLLCGVKKKRAKTSTSQKPRKKYLHKIKDKLTPLWLYH